VCDTAGSTSYSLLQQHSGGGRAMDVCLRAAGVTTPGSTNMVVGKVGTTVAVEVGHLVMIGSVYKARSRQVLLLLQSCQTMTHARHCMSKSLAAS